MSADIHALRFLLLTFAGWVNRHQQRVIGYLVEENRVLKDQIDAGWGYRRIQGALKNLGHRVARSTVAKVLQEEEIQPAPERRSSWRTFLKAHRGQVAGMDFFTTEVWTTLDGRTPLGSGPRLAAWQGRSSTAASTRVQHLQRASPRYPRPSRVRCR